MTADSTTARTPDSTTGYMQALEDVAVSAVSGSSVLVPCAWCGRDWFDHEHPEKGHEDAIC